MILSRAALILLGTISLCLGVTGLFIPGLPTTPFLLLTSVLYLKSSDKLYQKLVTNRHIGPYISEFHLNGGMSVRLKLYSIGLMWLMITVTSLIFINTLSLKLILVASGIIGTIVMGFIVPTTGNKKKKS